MKNTSMGVSNRTVATISLLFVSLIWGSSFPLAKYILYYTPIFVYLSFRFLFASLLFLPFSIRDMKKTSTKEWLISLAIGFILFAAFAFQTIGLKLSTSIKTSFIAGSYVVFVPILYTVLLKKTLPKQSIAATIITCLGLFLMSGRIEDLYNWDKGMALVALSCVFTALQIIAVDRYTKAIPVSILTLAQLITIAVCSIITVFMFEEWTLAIPIKAWLAILFLSVFATIIAYYIQCKMQQVLGPTTTGIIFSLECIFGAILSVILLDEFFTSHTIFASILLIIGMLLAESAPEEK